MSTLRTNTIVDAAGGNTTTINGGLPLNATSLRTELNTTGTAPIYACRAWVNFNGTGTVAIRSAGNVTSITDIAVGQYAVNFTTPMPDTNYAIVTGTANDSTATNFGYAGAVPVSTSQARIGNWVGAFADASTISVAIFR